MRKLNSLFFLCIILAGFLLVSLVWPENDSLPLLANVNEFQLEDVHEGMYQSNNGKVKVVTFFFIDCPDICPLTLMDFIDLQDQLKESSLFGDKVELVAITLDPKNDLPDKIKKYATDFGADPQGWKWLRGTTEETEKIAQKFQMQFQIRDGAVLYHSITMYLIDENQNIRALYDMALANKPIEIEKILADIELLVEK
ncbi:SCO family protein [Anaerobacillus isosaccharinicus]|uniref:Electron transport protein SCO1/SenC n=1 Tax=Anaerobacillus isosaccharinicus TaxID=1532552 RepID=A0A1S2M0H3_9BACI|nr:SCO family protein [Anaerobacillus isosaccharinicus]MBA5586562.1 SCO family protein [Anaerobacillus isosaccharinicus]QOY35202.1 SCO family protein [Anaerobacillus isosaccharinicus]